MTIQETFIRSGYTFRVFNKAGNLVWTSRTVYTRIEADRERARAAQI